MDFITSYDRTTVRSEKKREKRKGNVWREGEREREREREREGEGEKRSNENEGRGLNRSVDQV